MANDYGADAFVSIHQNSAESASANGIETYYNRNKEEEKPLSNDVQTQVINKTGATNRGVKNAGFTVLVKSNMISALVECGFISNESEVKNLSDSDYQDKLATRYSRWNRKLFKIKCNNRRKSNYSNRKSYKYR